MRKQSMLVATAIIGLSTIFSPLAESATAEDRTGSNWTREHVSKIELNEQNTAPIINADELEKLDDDYHTWDTWPLKNKDGSVATVNGYKIIFALSAPSDVLPGKVHDIAEIRYFYSKNGKDWVSGGPVFEEGDALGSRQWAGSAMIDENNQIHFFYTATGREGEEPLTYEQRFAKASADVVTSKNGVSFENWSDHQIILEADGEYYQTKEQGDQGDIAYAFRDPEFFKDPKSGEEYIIFEGNSSGAPADRSCLPEHSGSPEFAEHHEVPEGSVLFNGSIGIAKVTNDDYTEFELLPPLLEANCVNQELERPHIIVKGNQYYLFTDTHFDKFAPGITGPEGLYGFVSDELFGDYEPLNGSGLVIANPEENPFQAYSWLVLPNGTVISFVHFTDIGDLTIGDIGHQPEEFQFDHFGGMPAPSLKIALNQDRSRIVTELGQGVIK
ncbi:glycoside hydrolase family 68 protein [Halalkalibacterium halodurans]|uniref:glycoside hydrolase family 68 protein n=1 Tax=Halalkalibacterium halodurans TaxID=86665 RepID=UPI002AAA0BB6|nr:glycoside hydrolase family 68 protein [Halalkalibacterium halodurans]MDY7224150.1 glycoside hydrolase family 68 protein [Halalkalibacterium halodurans]MDY7243435.1 glycoside hydrolase family 68 protein [Halalkalibacterium halodurans]